MATNQEIFDKVLALLTKKTGGAKPCSVCGKDEWTIANRYVRLAASRNPNLFTTEPGLGFPLQPLICTTCGNTHLINLLTLGMSEEDLASMVYPPDADATK